MTPEPLSLSLLKRAATGESGSRIGRAVLSGTRAPAALVALREAGGPWSSEDLILSMDFHAPEIESRIPRARSLCRELAEAFGLKHVFDLNAGIGSAAVIEWALVRPGQIVAGCGRCLGVVGGVGALGLRLEDDDLTASLRTGTVPGDGLEAVLVRLEGRLPRHVGPWDLARAVRDALGDALSGRIVEIAGETRGMGIGFRAALCGLLTEMEAAAALVHPDGVTDAYYRERGREPDPLPPPEGGAAFTAEVSLDTAEIPAVVAASYTGEATRLDAVEETPVHGTFIGSCYGGYFEDFAVAAEILKKAGRVHPAVRLTLSPATLEVARACLNAGFYEIFLRSGAMVTVPGAGAGNVGGGAILGEGERLASTMEYHRVLQPGQGAPEVGILGPAAAAAAAASGRFADPADFIS